MQVLRIVGICLVLLVIGCARVETVVTGGGPESGESWERLSMDGRTIGFQRTAWSLEEIEGRPVRRLELQSRLVVQRHGTRTDVAMNIDSLSNRSSTGSGIFSSCTTTLSGGGEPVQTRCEIVRKPSGESKIVVSYSSRLKFPARTRERINESADLTTAKQLMPGQQVPTHTGHGIQPEKPETKREIPWNIECPGPEAVLESLLREPMNVGEEREITFFEPTFLCVLTAVLRAEKIESVSVDGQNRRLLRIRQEHRIGDRVDAETTVDPNNLARTLWTDAGGYPILTEMSMGDRRILAERTSRENAVALLQDDSTTEPSRLVEVGGLGVIPLNKAVSQSRLQPRIEFLVQMKDAAPSSRFPNTAFQQVVDIDARTARITVWSLVGLEEDKQGNVNFRQSQREPRPGDLESGHLIDLDNPKLRELAASVDSTDLSPWQTALALERLVHETVRQTTFSIAFASSSDVLESRSGDCTEFAVLLAALCRAKGIPARVTMGLVYTPLSDSAESPGKAEAGMSFHLWNEVLVDGTWRPLDATLALGGADAARLKIADDDLSGDALALLAGSILRLSDRITINVK